MTSRLLQYVVRSHYLYRARALSTWPPHSLPRTCRASATARTDGDELRRLVEEARTPRQTPRRPPTGSRELGDGTGRWRCCDCGVEKVAADFSFNAGGHVRSYCKACDAVKNREYRQTLRGNAGTLVRGARHRSKLKGWSCNLDTDFILDLILYQEGRCAYSGVQMENLLPHSDWRMSLERVNNTVGYVRENCVLIAAEFNSTEKLSKRVPITSTSGSSQWSLEKVLSFRAERQSSVDLWGLNRLIKAAQERYSSFPRPAILTSTAFQNVKSELEVLEGGFGRFRCSMCGLWKPASGFSLDKSRRTGLRSICKQCDGESKLRHRMTLRGHIQSMLQSARRRHKLGKWHGDFELDLDYVLKMLWWQQGRCFYSGVPLRFGEYNVDWKMSLERLDNGKTYTKGNAVLVALEFNTADHSARAVSPVSGSSQWSRSKVEHVWGSWEGPDRLFEPQIARLAQFE
ncbi:unnamed protein product [Durusdinium trenchii]|uniref:Uncharacterized protein n=1 Tax=Durusdinium trenchii TaxID=1381693 RepID=A0ABP0MVV7_9DINO